MKCNLANEKYRTEVHDYVVKTLGLDVGAAVALSKTNYYGSSDPTTAVGLITEINWDKVNVMTGFRTSWGTHEYGQKIQVKALVDGREEILGLTKLVNEKCHELIKNYDDAYYGWHVANIIGKSEVPLPEEWTTSYGEAWDYLVKKRSYDKLKNDGIIEHINKWVNR